MHINQLSNATTLWAVADLGEVIYCSSHEEINNEFPTQHHIAVTRPLVNGGVNLANDDLSIQAIVIGVDNVDISIIAFGQFLESIQEMVEGEE